jgi:hypothetical protein
MSGGPPYALALPIGYLQSPNSFFVMGLANVVRYQNQNWLITTQSNVHFGHQSRQSHVPRPRRHNESKRLALFAVDALGAERVVDLDRWAEEYGCSWTSPEVDADVAILPVAGLLKLLRVRAVTLDQAKPSVGKCVAVVSRSMPDTEPDLYLSTLHFPASIIARTTRRCYLSATGTTRSFGAPIVTPGPRSPDTWRLIGMLTGAIEIDGAATRSITEPTTVGYASDVSRIIQVIQTIAKSKRTSGSRIKR